ncbi:hypothetical protein [Streptomyces sp. NBC_01497]|uniref:hypothetical protein n=1 Tax=Streptomyces sp. NBC_01497 TaxID=2903885 RepID=UPI002E338254|nr:hypothetical protein [Streptomyces sp. NBC_01497]
MCAARQVRITYELRAADAARDDTASEPGAWWEESTEDLLRGLAELQPAGRGTDPLRADGDTAGFAAEVPAGVVSEAVRLTMSWIGRSPHREAILTGPRGDVLTLTGDPRPEELDLIASWLAATTTAGG